MVEDMPEDTAGAAGESGSGVVNWVRGMLLGQGDRWRWRGMGRTLEAGFDEVEGVDDDGGCDAGCEACDCFDEGGGEKGGVAHDLVAGGKGGRGIFGCRYRVY